MKKLALVLALVMVFAIAVPALAITGTDVSTTTTDPLSIDLAIVNSAAYALAPSSISSIVAAPSSYAEGSIVTIAAYIFAKNQDSLADGFDAAKYNVELTGVGAAPIADATGKVLAAGGKFNPSTGLLSDTFATSGAEPVALFKTTVLSLLATTNTYKTQAKIGLNPDATYKGAGTSPADLAYLYYYQYVVGTVPAEGGSITFKITESVPSNLDDYTQITTNWMPFWNKTTRARNLNVLKVTDTIMARVSETAGATLHKGYMVSNTDNDGLAIIIDGDGKVITGGLVFTDRAGGVYTIVNTHAATFSLIDGAGIVVTGDPLTHAKALWTKCADYFGFDYALNGVVNDSTFLSKYPTFALSKTVTFSSGVITITTPDSVIPPKTGDAASTFGFVMIAAAIIAAGALLVRKVRV